MTSCFSILSEKPKYIGIVEAVHMVQWQHCCLYEESQSLQVCVRLCLFIPVMELSSDTICEAGTTHMNCIFAKSCQMVLFSPHSVTEFFKTRHWCVSTVFLTQVTFLSSRHTDTLNSALLTNISLFCYTTQCDVYSWTFWKVKQQAN